MDDNTKTKNHKIIMGINSLRNEKIYNSQNPFDFMELISVESKVNFFERTNSEYALANKKVDNDVFELSCDF